MTAHENPMGTDGFEFVEYTAPDPRQLGALFEQRRVAARRAARLQSDCGRGGVEFAGRAERP